jgi:hypothetical protein
MATVVVCPVVSSLVLIEESSPLEVKERETIPLSNTTPPFTPFTPSAAAAAVALAVGVAVALMSLLVFVALRKKVAYPTGGREAIKDTATVLSFVSRP